jgi:hypothetical protein
LKMIHLQSFITYLKVCWVKWFFFKLKWRLAKYSFN